MGLIDSLRSKYELYRLEQRYTRREKRTTFASGAVYVDGEYIYQNGPPVSPGEGAPSPRDGASSSPASGMQSPSSSGPGSPMSTAGDKAPWGTGSMPESVFRR